MRFATAVVLAPPTVQYSPRRQVLRKRTLWLHTHASVRHLYPMALLAHRQSAERSISGGFWPSLCERVPKETLSVVVSAVDSSFPTWHWSRVAKAR